jgi:hypothetical protein
VEETHDNRIFRDHVLVGMDAWDIPPAEKMRCNTILLCHMETISKFVLTARG